MSNYRPSYIMELEPGVFRYALPKNLNKYAYDYLASGLTKSPSDYDDGTYQGISYSTTYRTAEDCIEALRRKYGNFGSYDIQDLNGNMPESRLPEIALDLIKCHQKDNPGYRYPNTDEVVYGRRLKEYIGLSGKDVSYVFTSEFGHIEYEFNLDTTKHGKNDIFKGSPNVYFYDKRVCPVESHYTIKSVRDWHDFSFILTDMASGKEYTVVDFSHYKYQIGSQDVREFWENYIYAKSKGNPDKSMLRYMREIYERICHSKPVEVLYFESGEPKTKEYFRSKGYAVYDN